MKMRQHRKRQPSQPSDALRPGPGSHRKQVALFAARLQVAARLAEEIRGIAAMLERGPANPKDLH